MSIRAEYPSRKVTIEDLEQRVIRRQDLVSCNEAFIDCRTPGSDRKENYALIGPGVSQNDAQFVNLPVPHGFNVGGAAMPPGVTNSLHLHFTAEVFIIQAGAYEYRWGVDGQAGSFVARAGDVISIPTWIFRGFTNVGSDDNFMFSVLGQDDTGGILWSPSVLREAERYGLYLSKANRLIDTAAGETVDGVDLITPLPDEYISRLRTYTAHEMRLRVNQDSDREWFPDSLLCTAVPGGSVELAVIIGFGMTEHRDQTPRVYNPHGFNVSALRSGPGQGMLMHRHNKTQVLIVRSGEWLVEINVEDTLAVRLYDGDTISVPPNAWRRFINVSDRSGELYIVNGGDERVRLDWSAEVLAAAAAVDVGYDANGYLAPKSAIPRFVEQ